MKKNLLFNGFFKKALAMGVVLVASATSAFAGEQTYYDYYANLQTYPTGAGTVYVDMEGDSNATLTDANDEPLSDMKTPAENIEVKFIYNGYSSSAYFKPVPTPAVGWIFAGYSACTKNDEGEHIFNDSIFEKDPTASIQMTSLISDADLTTAQSMFPLSADTTFYALFTHVAVGLCVGQDQLGEATISKVCNNINDVVTLTATPFVPDSTKFDYWIKKETGEKFTDNPLTITVQDTAHYLAHFTSELAETITFPEEGGYAILHSNYSLRIPNDVYALNFSYSPGAWGDSIRYNNEKFYQEPVKSGYQTYANETYIMNGKGEVTFFKVAQETTSTSSYIKWTDAETKVADLAVSCHYYNINLDKGQFELIADNAVLPANSAYCAIPNERYEVYGVTEAPKVIYMYDPENPTGIENVTANKVVKKSLKGIYNINGQKVEKMAAKGLYIVDGKKVINITK